MAKSSCSSFASRATKRSKISLITLSGSAAGLSILLITTIGFSPKDRAFLTTNLVCGITPSCASTKSKTPSIIFKTRSTSPPKSAWPGVSMMLIFVPL